MESKKQEIKQLCVQFKPGGIPAALDQTISQAEGKGMGFMQHTIELLQAEAAHRMHKDELRRFKSAGLPRNSGLDHYDTSVDNGLKPKHVS